VASRSKRGDLPVEVSIEARDFTNALAQAKAFDSKLYTELRANLRRVGNEAAQDARREVMKPPRKVVTSTRLKVFHSQRVTAGGQRGPVTYSAHHLRQGIRDGIKVSIKATPNARQVGVFIVSKGSDERSVILKRVWDFPKGFRHPVFADANRTRKQWKWVPQAGRPYFHSTMSAKQPAFAKAVAQALATAVAKIPNSKP